jgi:hypothetical protein
MIGRYQQYMAALDLLQMYFPSDEVEHLIITSLTKFKQRIEDALKTFGHTVVEVQAYEERPVIVDKPEVDDPDEL